MHRKIFQLFFLGAALWLCAGPAFPSDKTLNIVATQAIFADIVKQVGGDKVVVSAVASPKYNVHFIQPKPSDVRRVAKADLYVNGGLDLEAWSDPLLEAAGKPALFRNAQRNVDLSRGIVLLDVPDHPLSRAEGDIHVFGNPHVHMNPENALIMAQTIAEKLKEIDPTNAAYYESNAQAFGSRLKQKIVQWKGLCAHCRGQKIISYHADIAYFAEFLGIKVEQFIEPKPGIPPTPKHLRALEDYALEHQVKAVVLPTYFFSSTADRLAERIGAKVVTVCQNAGELPGTEDLFGFFDRNIKEISEALL